MTLRDASVSRAHARLERDGDGWRIVDTGSRNGLFLGKERVPTAPLADGDEFRLGEVLLRFRVDVQASMASAAGAAPVASPVAPPVSPPDRGPALQFNARGPSRAEPAQEHEEIELEGDWTAPASPAVPPPAPRAPAPAPAPAPATASRAGPPPPAAVAHVRSAATDERARKLAAAGIAAPAAARDARGVLQFHKVEQKDGVLRQDFAEQPTWVRTVVIAAALAAAAAMAWLGYRAATGAKSRLVAEPAESGPPDGSEAR